MVEGQAGLVKAIIEEKPAHFAGISHRTLKSLPNIDLDRLPKNYRDAMSMADRWEWAEAHDKEYRGFQKWNAFKPVSPEPGLRVHDTLTGAE
jgi:hypothetical protein